MVTKKTAIESWPVQMAVFDQCRRLGGLLTSLVPRLSPLINERKPGDEASLLTYIHKLDRLHCNFDLDGIITAKGCIIQTEDGGITLIVPEGALKPEDGEVGTFIHKFVTQLFYYPKGRQAASPAFNMWPSKTLSLQKGATVRIKHMALLRNEEDCQKLEFMIAFSGPLKTFQNIITVKGTFKPGSPFGETTLDSLPCFVVITVPSDSAHDLGVLPDHSASSIDPISSTIESRDLQCRL